MADPGPKEPFQHAHCSNEINFGHPGTATYHEGEQSWSFLRTPRPDSKGRSGEQIQSSVIEIVQQPKLVIKVEPSTDVSQHSTEPLSAIHFQTAIPDVTQTILHNENTDVLSGTSTDRSRIQTSLLDFGSVPVLGSDDNQAGWQTVPVAAYVLAAEPEKLVLTLLDTETFSHSAGAIYSVQIPSIANVQSTQFVARNGIIQQISFSHGSSTQDSGWLAIRQTGATSILQPLLHRAVITSIEIPSLDPNLIVEIPNSRTGDLPHADVQFHPNDPSRIAIIDVGGNWSVWKLSGIRSRSARVLYRLRLATQGSFVSQPEEACQFDGWHKLIWLHHTHQTTDLFLVANRQSLALFNNNGLLLVERDERISRRFKGSILDVLSIRDCTHVVVLTTTHVYLMDVNAAEAGPGNRSSENSRIMSTKVFWNHARDFNDRTLKIYALPYSNVTLLLLVSNATRAITFYQIHMEPDDNDTTCSVSDPMWLDIHSTGHVKSKLLDIRSMAAESSPSELLEDINFFKAFMQDDTGSIYEVLCKFQHPGSRLFHDTTMIPMPKKQFLYHMSGYRVEDNKSESDLEDFITADDDGNSLFVETLSTTMSHNLRELESGGRQIRVCDLHATYGFLVARMRPTRPEDEIQIDDVLDLLPNAIQGSRLQTLRNFASEAFETEPSTVELERDSNRLDVWTRGLGDAEPSEVEDESVSHPKCSRVWMTQSLLELYEDLVKSWLSSLSDTVPDRVRVQRERLLRRVALDLYFSSTIVGPSSRRLTVDTLDVSHNSNYLNSSQTLPADSLANDEAESSAHEHEEESTNFEKSSMLLDSYTNFKIPERMNTKPTSAAQNILAHLPATFDVHPDTYSYNDAELSVELAKNEFADRQLDPKARRKAERLARAKKKQIDKQTQLKKVVFERSTALPSIMSSQLPIRGVQSSQVAPASSSQPSGTNLAFLSMTQPERGVYGKRDTKKGKGKGKASRQKGF